MVSESQLELFTTDGSSAFKVAEPLALVGARYPAREAQGNARPGTPGDAASDADALLLAVPWLPCSAPATFVSRPSL